MAIMTEFIIIEVFFDVKNPAEFEITVAIVQKKDLKTK